MFLEWNDSLETGVEEIDSDHRCLISLANRIHNAALAGNREEVADLVLEFSNYCDDHFVMEEEFMRDIHYPHRAEHKRDVACRDAPGKPFSPVTPRLALAT